LKGDELKVMLAAVEGDPRKTTVGPTVRTHSAPAEGLTERYHERFVGGPPPNEGYNTVRSRLVQRLNEAEAQHDSVQVTRWRDLVETLDNRFNAAAKAEQANEVDRVLDKSGQSLDALRATAFDRPEAKK
jgi:hypothetical protein